MKLFQKYLILLLTLFLIQQSQCLNKKKFKNKLQKANLKKFHSKKNKLHKKDKQQEVSQQNEKQQNIRQHEINNNTLNHNQTQNNTKRFKEKWIPPPRFTQMKVEPGPIIKQGWLRLASDPLANINRFPPVPQDDKQQSLVDMAQLTLKENKALPNNLWKIGNFRKNSQYCPLGSIPTIDSFWFRLNGQNLYYTELKDDSVVLGSIQISNMVKSIQGYKGCFKITDKEMDYWMLCSTDGSCNYEWQCAIDKILGRPCTPCQDDEDSILEIAPQLIQPVAAPICKFDWNYNFHGQNWVCNCNEGREQSPIDLPAKDALELVQYNAQFSYDYVNPEDLEVVYYVNLCRIRTKNNKIFGTLQDVDGNIYEAYEIQIHTPGEHTMQEYQTDMEVQIIHRCVEGKIRYQAALSILYKRSPGTVQTVWEIIDVLNLPNPVYNVGENVMKGPLNIMNFIYDCPELVRNPPAFGYYKYQGSNTQPPCAEFVVWFIYEKKLEISSTILVMFRDVLNIPLQDSSSTNLNFDGSNRKIMPLLDRKIYFYDPEQGCFPIKRPAPKIEGHYEVITKPANQYWYVQGFHPSGIKGAQVVSQKEADALPNDIWRETDRYGAQRVVPQK